MQPPSYSLYSILTSEQIRTEASLLTTAQYLQAFFGAFVPKCRYLNYLQYSPRRLRSANRIRPYIVQQGSLLYQGTLLVQTVPTSRYLQYNRYSLTSASLAFLVVDPILLICYPSIALRPNRSLSSSNRRLRRSRQSTTALAIYLGAPRLQQRK